MPYLRQSRIDAIIAEEGVTELQAIRILQMQNARHDEYRRRPRSFDHRFEGN